MESKVGKCPGECPYCQKRFDTSNYHQMLSFTSHVSDCGKEYLKIQYNNIGNSDNSTSDSRLTSKSEKEVFQSQYNNFKPNKNSSKPNNPNSSNYSEYANGNFSPSVNYSSGVQKPSAAQYDGNHDVNNSPYYDSSNNNNFDEDNSYNNNFEDDIGMNESRGGNYAINYENYNNNNNNTNFGNQEGLGYDDNNNVDNNNDDTLLFDDSVNFLEDKVPDLPVFDWNERRGNGGSTVGSFDDLYGTGGSSGEDGKNDVIPPVPIFASEDKTVYPMSTIASGIPVKQIRIPKVLKKKNTSKARKVTVAYSKREYLESILKNEDGWKREHVLVAFPESGILYYMDSEELGNLGLWNGIQYSKKNYTDSEITLNILGERTKCIRRTARCKGIKKCPNFVNCGFYISPKLSGNRSKCTECDEVCILSDCNVKFIHIREKEGIMHQQRNWLLSVSDHQHDRPGMVKTTKASKERIVTHFENNPQATPSQVLKNGIGGGIPLYMQDPTVHPGKLRYYKRISRKKSFLGPSSSPNGFCFTFFEQQFKVFIKNMKEKSQKGGEYDICSLMNKQILEDFEYYIQDYSFNKVGLNYITTMTKSGANVLAKSKVWFVDDTFSESEDYNLFNIVCYNKERQGYQICMRIRTNKRDREALEVVLDQVDESLKFYKEKKVLEVEPLELKYRHHMFDFYKEQAKVLKRKFQQKYGEIEGLRLYQENCDGCDFHFGQSTWRHARKTNEAVWFYDQMMKLKTCEYTEVYKIKEELLAKFPEKKKLLEWWTDPDILCMINPKISNQPEKLVKVNNAVESANNWQGNRENDKVAIMGFLKSALFDLKLSGSYYRKREFRVPRGYGIYGSRRNDLTVENENEKNEYMKHIDLNEDERRKYNTGMNSYFLNMKNKKTKKTKRKKSRKKRKRKTDGGENKPEDEPERKNSVKVIYQAPKKQKVINQKDEGNMRITISLHSSPFVCCQCDGVDSCENLMKCRKCEKYFHKKKQSRELKRCGYSTESNCLECYKDKN